MRGVIGKSSERQMDLFKAEAGEAEMNKKSSKQRTALAVTGCGSGPHKNNNKKECKTNGQGNEWGGHNTDGSGNVFENNNKTNEKSAHPKKRRESSIAVAMLMWRMHAVHFLHCCRGGTSFI